MPSSAPKRTRTYPEILAELREYREEWRRLDLRVSRSRFDAYERALVRLQAVVEDPALAVTLSPSEVSFFYQMLADIYEFNDVSRWLLKSHGVKFGKRVRKVFSGPDVQSDEKDGASGTSRNTLFELTVASFIHQSGLPIDITGISDVVSEFEGRSVVVEAKRPLTKAGARGLVREAVSQLKKRFPNGKGEGIGIIAMSCSRIWTEGTKMASNASNDVIQAALESAHHQLTDDIRVEWSSSDFVDAVLLYSTVVGSSSGPDIHSFVTVLANRPEGHPLEGPVARLFALIGTAIKAS